MGANIRFVTELFVGRKLDYHSDNKKLKRI